MASGLRFTSPIIKKKANRVIKDIRSEIKEETNLSRQNGDPATPPNEQLVDSLATPIKKKHHRAPGAVSHTEKSITPVGLLLTVAGSQVFQSFFHIRKINCKQMYMKQSLIIYNNYVNDIACFFDINGPSEMTINGIEFNVWISCKNLMKSLNISIQDSFKARVNCFE